MIFSRQKTKKIREDVFEDKVFALEKVKKPGTLPCGHVFDRENPKSISGYIKQKEKEAAEKKSAMVLNCPCCKEEFKKEDVLPLVAGWGRLVEQKAQADSLAKDTKSTLDVTKRELERRTSENSKLSEEIAAQKRAHESDINSRDLEASGRERRLYYQISQLQSQLGELKQKHALELKNQSERAATRQAQLQSQIKTVVEQLAEKDKIITALTAVADEKSPSFIIAKNLAATSEKLKNIFHAEKVIQRAASLVPVTEQKNEKILDNVEKILKLKQQLAKEKTNKAQLAEKLERDGKELMSLLPKSKDSSEITRKVAALYEKFAVDDKEQNERIEKIQKEIQLLREANFKELGAFLKKKMLYKMANNKIAVEREKQRAEIENLTKQKALTNMPFFHRHHNSLYGLMEKAQLTCALDAAVKRHDYAKAEEALKRGANPDGRKRSSSEYKYGDPESHILYVAAACDIDTKMMYLLLRNESNPNFWFRVNKGKENEYSHTLLTYLLDHYPNIKTRENVLDVICLLIDQMDQPKLNCRFKRMIRVSYSFEDRDEEERYDAFYLACKHSLESVVVHLINNKNLKLERNEFENLNFYLPKNKNIADALAQRKANCVDSKDWSYEIEAYIKSAEPPRCASDDYRYGYR